MEIDALEKLISEDVKVQRQIVRDGFRTCLMVFRIVAGVAVGVIAGGDEVYHHCFAWVVAGGVRCDNPPRKIPYYRLNQSTLFIK
jgi:hypothetical protein